MLAAVLLQLVSHSVEASARDSQDQETGEVLLQLEVFLNGEPLHLIAPFRLLPDGRLQTSRNELREIGLAVEIDPEGSVDARLDELEGVTYRYIAEDQSIYIVAEPNRLALREYGMQTSRILEPTRPPPGVIVNYAINISGSQKSDEARFYDGLNGLFEARAFGGFGLVESAQVARWNPSGRLDLVRLDTRYIFEDPEHLRTLIVGDTVSGGLGWSRPVRMAGVQLRRSFGQRPDLVTVPVLRFRGTAAVPTAAELLIDQRPVLNVDTPPGPYLINVPGTAYGQGNATLVLTDPTGQRFAASLPFYGSPLLLAPGLTDYSAEAGVTRRSFGYFSADYDDRPFISGTIRRGLSDKITLQGHFEAAEGLALAGAGAVLNVQNQFLLSASAAGSSGGRGDGGLVELAFERRTRLYGVYLRSQRTWGRFDDLASHTALTDGEGFNAFVAPPAQLDQASAWAALPHGASIWVNYLSAERASSTSRIASLGVSKDFGRFSVYTNASYDFEGDRSASIFVGISVPLGREAIGSAGAVNALDDSYGFVEASRWRLNETGDWGAAARLTAGDRRDASLRLAYLARTAELEVVVDSIDKSTSATARASGAIGFVAGEWNAGRRSYDSYAIVDAGHPNVPVLYENRRVGRTGPGGRLVIPNLTAFSPNRISVDPTGLPLDVELVATEALVAPFSRVPVLVDFNVRMLANVALVVFVDPSQTSLPVGSFGALEGELDTFAVGYDGEAWLDGLEAHNSVLITTPENGRCEASFEYRPRPGQQVRIGPVICRPIDAGVE